MKKCDKDALTHPWCVFCLCCFSGGGFGLVLSLDMSFGELLNVSNSFSGHVIWRAPEGVKQLDLLFLWVGRLESS